MSEIMNVAQYKQLVQALRDLLARGQALAQEAVARQLVETYWQIGQRIAREALDDQTQSTHSLLRQLADDVGLPYRTLCYCQQFYDQYPTLPRDSVLKWSHYRELLILKDEDERQWYEAQVEERGLSRDQLLMLMKKDGYAYQRDAHVDSSSASVVRPTQSTYLYKAIIEKVVDGDTLLARIDLGFDTWRSQRLRLAQIDAPPLKEKAGQDARAYIEEELSPCEWVMIRTNRIDMYARYIADVFYLPNEKNKDRVFLEGKHLNVELVKQGLAQVF